MRSLYTYSFLAFTFAAVAGAQIVLDPTPARVSGHQSMTPAEQLVVTNINPNFGVNGGMYSPLGVAVDTSGATPILYVADAGNNRVLAWKNATSATLTNLQPPDLIIGQPDPYTTFPSTNGGLFNPTGLAVDAKGNLYVADSGNNRVLRYPTPFANSSGKPDIVLGQPDMFTSRSPNQAGTVKATTLYLGSGTPSCSCYIVAMAFDSSGNLYVTDAGNDRVLQFASGSLTSGATDPAASIVIGQAGLTVVNSPPLGRLDRNTLYTPAGLAIDSAGHLFISDSYASRILVFTPPFSNGMAASRLAGIVSPTPDGATASTLNDPEGLVMINNGVGVLDTGDNRLLMFDPYSSADWAVASGDTTVAASPPVATSVLGQGPSLTSFTTTAANAGNPQASANNIATFSTPVAAAMAGTDLFVVDTGNNRLLVYPNAGQAGTATVVLGQSAFPYNSPNSIHGKEFYFGPNPGFPLPTLGGAYDAGIAVDSSGSIPHLYVSDPNNHRVLGFADARKVGPGVQADIVIGEPDLATSVCNFGGVANAPGTETLPRQPTASSLCYPTGLAVDPGTGPSGAATQGDLFVADSANGRVLRFPAPFAPNAKLHADLVLGQSGFTGISNPQASQSVLAFPYGLVFDPQRGLLVSDESANRVLLFSIANPANGESASTVIGQPNFTSTGNSVLNSPHHIAEDTVGEVYVADTGHNQILIFDIPTGSSTDTPVSSFTGLSSPEAVWVNPNTVAAYHNDIWVGDSSGLSRWPVPNPLGTNTATLRMTAVEVTAGQSLACPGTGFCGYPAIAVTQDSFGALYVADTSNRVAIHYPALAAENTASSVCAMGCNLGGLTDAQFYEAPGAFASLYPFNGLSFASGTTVNSVIPVPTSLGGIQVQVDGRSSPITFVSSGQINFLVPFEAPTSGTAQVEVVNASTSQVLGSGSMTMNVGSPGFFTSNSQGTGQIAALNQDNTVNSPSNMAKPSSYIQLFLTGQGAGLQGGAPPDGQPTSGALSTSSLPAVYIGGSLATLSYSGLAPGYPGLWQINVQIPSAPIALPGFPVNIFPVLVSYEGLTSNTSANNSNPNAATTIAISAQ